MEYDGAFEYLPIIMVRNQSGSEVGVYPNPVVTDHVTLSGSANEQFIASIVAMSGLEVFKWTGTISEIENRLNGGISQIDPSVYLLKLRSGSQSQTIRFIKK